MTKLAGWLGVAAAVLAGQAGAEEVWRATGFDSPESALLDAGGQALYVSNIAGEMTGKDGTGFISKLGLDGTLAEREWVTGLDAPKGMALHDGTLYVADIDRLVAIDVGAGAVGDSWAAEGAQFLNDVVADDAGRVFVSDMLGGRIYVLEGGALSVWVEGEALMHPNGLEVADGKLIVAPWGSGLKDDFTTETGGHLLEIDLESREIADHGSGEAVGNLDGIRPDGDGGWLVTDWIAGALLRIAPDGSFETLEDLPAGSADLEFAGGERLAVIPLMLDGTVVAHRIE
jgi:sugar lactone lactonase YvrE